MAPTISLVFGGLAATYFFLRFLLNLTQDAREPPAILTGIPFIQPLVGMIREKERFYIRLRDTTRLPIYTLRLPFQRIYVVNATELIPVVQKQWRLISFAAIAADAGDVVGMSKEALAVMKADLTSDHGFSTSWPKYIMPVMAPGPDLDAINRRAIELYVSELAKLRAQGAPTVVGLRDWSRKMMVDSTSEAIWGLQNPYRDPVVADAWKTFEAGFLTLAMFPMARLFFPRLVRAREIAAKAMIDYMHRDGYKTASGLVKKRVAHHRDLFGLSKDDIGRGELGNTFAVLGNTAPCALWVLYHIFSDAAVLADVRRELAALVEDEGTDAEGHPVSAIDLARIKDSCPALLSTFQETLRFRAVNPGPRVVLEDVLLDGGRILLKKGSMLMIPAPVQHTDAAAWGDDARAFDHLRFARKKQPGPGPDLGRPRPNNRVAFRAFGGGHVLCPGRHFAATEILSLAALLALQFDVVPTAGAWAEPTWHNSPSQAGFPVIDQDIPVELRPRDPRRRWRVTFSGSDKAMEIVSEDIAAGGRGAM
ncbi:b4576777-2013-4262-b571-3b18ab8788b6 [Thermothielavioides terrestris]|uniref:B4576777-2013-4262-b571-3b18ab8788b6 n=1 Tax=Thermothielavioides terrestris TaxID=2587410 RepID=A0A446BDZ7_9PEZI|nr:b4576777-2013-4262-b571-3b18ab8788b6 [Thermothielavioides terrestris]